MWKALASWFTPRADFWRTHINLDSYGNESAGGVVHETAVIGEHVRIAPSSGIGRYCGLEDGVTVGRQVSVEQRCTIGARTNIDEGVIICERVRIGVGVHIARGALIGPGVTIGDYVRIGTDAQLAEGSDVGNSVSIGNNVRIGDDAVLKDEASIHSGAKVGAGVRMGARVSVREGATIGGGAVIGTNAYIGRQSRIGRRAKVGESCEIGDDVRVGSGAVLGDGAVVHLSALIHRWARIGRAARIGYSHRVLIFERVQDDRCVGINAQAPVPKGELLSSKRNGFTLIELSIVLIIIGLIVGGVLVGRSVISAAAVRAQISQIEKYNTAANTFLGKYGYLPGDLLATSAATFGLSVGQYCDGSTLGTRDGNGLLDGGYSPFQLAQGVGEVELFWVDLSTINLIDGTFPNGSANIIGCSTSSHYWPRSPATVSSAQIGWYLPQAKLGGGNYVFVYEASGSNWFGISGVTYIADISVVTASPVIPVIQAANIDSKVDDGFPLTGRVQAVYINASRTNTAFAPNAASDSATTCYNTGTAAGAYSIAYNYGNGANCAISFRFQ